MTSSPPDTGDPALGDVLAWVRRLGIDPKRSLGQNFLVDRAHLDRIVAAAALSSDDTVLEIGPGPGTLTARLAAQAAPRGLPVVAVELDDRLIEPLRRHFAPRGNVKIIHGDILKLDPVALLPAGTSAYKVVANLPYYITSAVLRHILEASLRPTLAVVMVDKVKARVARHMGDVVRRPGDQIVHRHHIMALGQEPVDQMTTQKPCAACHKDTHSRSSFLDFALLERWRTVPPQWFPIAGAAARKQT